MSDPIPYSLVINKEQILQHLGNLLQGVDLNTLSFAVPGGLASMAIPGLITNQVIEYTYGISVTPSLLAQGFNAVAPFLSNIGIDISGVAAELLGSTGAVTGTTSAIAAAALPVAAIAYAVIGIVEQQIQVKHMQEADIRRKVQLKNQILQLQQHRKLLNIQLEKQKINLPVLQNPNYINTAKLVTQDFSTTVDKYKLKLLGYKTSVDLNGIWTFQNKVFGTNNVIQSKAVQRKQNDSEILQFKINNGKTTIENPSCIFRYNNLPRNTQNIKFKLNGRIYKANSLQTLYGRDKKKTNEAIGQFSGIYTLTENDILRLLGHGMYIFQYSGKSQIDTVLQKSVGGALDYKNTLYTILNINRDTLIEIDGITYNPNEAGNFIWGMVLNYNDFNISPNLIAELGTKGGKDEVWEQRAITAGIKKSQIISNNESLINRIEELMKEFIPE